jgi:hypothetical protein
MVLLVIGLGTLTGNASEGGGRDAGLHRQMLQGKGNDVWEMLVKNVF